MTSCGHIERDFSAYRDDELTAGEREAYEAHLGACSDCGELVEHWDDALMDLNRLGGFPVPDELEDLVLARLEAEAPAPARMALWPLLVVTSVAASLLTVWIVGLFGERDAATHRLGLETANLILIEAVVGEAEVLDRESGRWRPIGPGMELEAPAVLRGAADDATVELSDLGFVTVPAGRLAWVGPGGGRLLPGSERRSRVLPVAIQPDRTEDALTRARGASHDSAGEYPSSKSETSPRRPVPRRSVKALRAIWESGLDWQENLAAGQSRWWDEMGDLLAEGARYTRAASDLLRAEFDSRPVRPGPLSLTTEAVASDLGPKASDAPNRDIVMLPPSDPSVTRSRETLRILRRRGEVELVTRGRYSKRIPLLLDILETEPGLQDLARAQLEELRAELERDREFRAGQPKPFPPPDEPNAVEWLTDGAGLPPALQRDPRRREEQDDLRRWQEWWRSNRDLIARVDPAPAEFF